MEQKNSSKTGLYVTIGVLSTVVVGLLIALIVVILVGGNKTCSEGGDLADSSVEERDAQRSKDIARFINAASDYQANNSGRTPWYTGETNEKFVARYIDATCIHSTYGYICSESSNSFRDPDGKTYDFEYLGTMDYSSDIKYFNGNVDGHAAVFPNGHKIMVVTNAACGDDGKTKKSYNERQFAMLYRLENGSIACKDNY